MQGVMRNERQNSRGGRERKGLFGAGGLRRRPWRNRGVETRDSWSRVTIWELELDSKCCRDLGLGRGSRKDESMMLWQPSQESVEGRAGRAPVLTALHVVCAS